MDLYMQQYVTDTSIHMYTHIYMHLYTHTHRREYKNHNKFVSHSPLNILIKTILLKKSCQTLYYAWYKNGILSLFNSLSLECNI